MNASAQKSLEDKIGAEVSYSINQHTGSSGTLIGCMSEYALIERHEDTVVAVEKWRLRD